MSERDDRKRESYLPKTRLIKKEIIRTSWTVKVTVGHSALAFTELAVAATAGRLTFQVAPVRCPAQRPYRPDCASLKRRSGSAAGQLASTFVRLWAPYQSHGVCVPAQPVVHAEPPGSCTEPLTICSTQDNRPSSSPPRPHTTAGECPLPAC